MPSWRIYNTHADRKREVSAEESEGLRRPRANPGMLSRYLGAAGVRRPASRDNVNAAEGDDTLAASSTTREVAVVGRRLLSPAEAPPCNATVHRDRRVGTAAVPVRDVQRDAILAHAAMITTPPRLVASEICRGIRVDELRGIFVKLLAQRGIPKPREAFNRWLFEERARLSQFTEDTTAKLPEVPVGPPSSPAVVVPTDPLIPTVLDATHRHSSAITEELMVDAATVIPDEAKRRVAIADITANLTSQALRLATAQAAEDAKRNGCDGDGSATVTAAVRYPVAAITGRVRLRLGEAPYAFKHEMLGPHFNKLRDLYETHNGARPADDDEAASAWESRFQWSVALLCERYRGAAGVKPNEGSGLHAAVPGEVMEVFRRRLGVDMEGFASPFNCYFRHFCSAFVDTDRPFGSCGSFFDLDFASGSIEVNPPFVEEVMEPLAARMTALLAQSDATGSKLTFVLVVPEWRRPPTPCIERIEANKDGYLRRSVRVMREAHCYFDGFQHCLKEAYFRPVHHTMVYVLQSAAAAADGGADDAFESELASVWGECAAKVKPNAFVEELNKTAGAATRVAGEKSSREAVD